MVFFSSRSLHVAESTRLDFLPYPFSDRLVVTRRVFMFLVRDKDVSSTFLLYIHLERRTFLYLHVRPVQISWVRVDVIATHVFCLAP